jgi:hypothetical protein
VQLGTIRAHAMIVDLELSCVEPHVLWNLSAHDTSISRYSHLGPAEDALPIPDGTGFRQVAQLQALV